MQVTKKISYLIIALIFYASVSAQDLKLWYSKPAVKWTEALPIGNGRIGAMVFGGVEQDRIQFNEETLWTGEPRNYNRVGAYKYLDSIRNLLFAGKQKEAEALAEKEFMGLKSNEGKKDEWIKQVLQNTSYANESYDDSKWETMQVPSYDGWEVVGHDGLDGAVWLRTNFTLPSDWINKNIILDLNRVSNSDLTYINGKLIGSQENNDPRKYTMPNNLIHVGLNSIAVLVLNFTDKGGIQGYKDTAKKIGLCNTENETDKIIINGNWKYKIVNDNPPAMGTYQASYQPFGDLYLNFNDVNNTVNYKRELNFENAVATTSYSNNGIDFKREYFASAPNQLVAINLSASKKASINFEAVLSSPHKNFVVNKIDDKTISLQVQVKNGALKGESHLQIKLNGGKLTIENGKLVIENADEATLYLSAATNFNTYKEVAKNVNQSNLLAYQKVKSISYRQVKNTHVKEYQKWFNTFSISFGDKINNVATDERLNAFTNGNDPSFAALYLQYGRYLLISSSRPGTKPANLQGIWNDLLNPPWGSKYTTNINAEMNYWPAENLNLSAMHQPLFAMIDELSQSGTQTAKEYYNANGWVLHHNTDIWRGTAPINAANHGIWVTGGAWLCQHLWEHYLFTQDKAFLKKVYPTMKQAAQFFNSYLVKDKNSNYLISTPSNSPEQGGLVAGPTMDHQIIRNLFSNVTEASKILNVDVPFKNSLQEKIKLIAPNKIGKYGQLQEWMQDKDDTTNRHRHISHLWGMFPGNEINFDETPALMNAAKQSLLYRGDAATGWSLGWKINCWARLKDAEHTWQMIKMLLSPTKGNGGSYPNLFDAHPPFQIDGNFGGAAGIGEMLLQSHTKYIDVLPALPVALSTGYVKGICARGGFVIDIKWKDGKLQNLIVTSKAGLPLVLRYNNIVKNISTIKNGVYKFNASLSQL